MMDERRDGLPTSGNAADLTIRGPITLGYATPPPAATGFAREPRPVIVLLAVLVPGLASSLIRRTAWPCVCLGLAIPLAFLFFGPFWGEVLFRSASRAWREVGVYPFVLTCVIVVLVSVLLALDDRRRALGDVNPRLPPAP